MNALQKIFLIALLITFFPTPAFSGSYQLVTNLVRTSNNQTEISQQNAIAIAQRQIKGRLLDVKRSGDVYRIKILSDQGSIHIVQVSATDGTIKSGQ